MGEAKVCVYADSGQNLGQMNDSKEAIVSGKVQRKDSGCIFLTKKQWESMEKQLDSSAIFPRIFAISYPSRDPNRFGQKDNQTRRVQGPGHLHINVQ